MDRKDFSSLLAGQREARGMGKNELCRAIGFTFSQLQRLENALNNFNMNLAFRYLNAVGAVLVLDNGKTVRVCQEYNECIKWLVSVREGVCSYRQLATLAQCSSAAIAYIEHGKVVASIDLFLKLVGAFGYDVKIEPKEKHDL